MQSIPMVPSPLPFRAGPTTFPRMMMIRSRGWLVFAVGLAACRPSGTVVVLTTTDAAGRPVPMASMPIVILPYDRDSVAEALTAAGAPRPDTLPEARLLDSLRGAYRATLGRTGPEQVAAKARFDRLRMALAPRLDSLRLLQQGWRAAVYGGYDTLTLALTHRLLRDPFADTTDTRGIAVVRPKNDGRWWVTVATWDATDPYADRYWNLPLTGDTLRLTPQNAQRRTRF